MNFEQIKPYNISNGTGIRVSLFVTGCSHGCKGCFNREIWSKNAGKPFKNEDKSRILQLLAPACVTGLTLLGGDPMMPYNAPELTLLVKEVKELYPGKDVWVYSGFAYEQIMKDPVKKELLVHCDVLVDGKFEQELYSPLLRFRGSSNQRIIDIKKSLQAGRVELLIE